MWSRIVSVYEMVEVRIPIADVHADHVFYRTVRLLDLAIRLWRGSDFLLRTQSTT